METTSVEEDTAPCNEIESGNPDTASDEEISRGASVSFSGFLADWEDAPGEQYESPLLR